jgi:hypothetical protein
MTSTAYYPTIKWYYYNATGAAWVDISGYVLTKQGVSGHWGMRSNKYTDRLAATGEMRMLLDNTDGVFDPDDASALTGWAINTKVKMVVTFDGVDYVRFYGKVDTLKFSDPNTHEHTAQVLVSDWMGYAYKKTLGEQSIETYKRGGELCAEIVTEVGQTPLATSYAVGDYEFPAAFDSMTTTAKAATELNKIVLSENGYFYNRHDKVNGETLVFEAESARNSTRTVSKLPKLVADCGFVLKAGSATDHVLIAGSATDKVVMNEVQDAHINGTAQRYERSHGENIINKVTVTAYPKRTDTKEQTLYSLGEVIRISSGETKTINVRYQNADTKESCNAITSLMVDPVATTDYKMNTSKDGKGKDLTSSLTVSVVFRTAEAEITLTNTSGYLGQITKLQLRGYGVYQDSSIKAVVEDTSSQASYSETELNIKQQYQRDVVAGKLWAKKIVGVESSPRTKLNKITFCANKSEMRMLAFLACDIGDLVKITESGLNLDGYYYYINGIEFAITEGNIITYSWILDDSAGISENRFSNVALEFSPSSEDIIEFGEIPSLVDLPDQSITAWCDVTTIGAWCDIVCMWVDNAGGLEWGVGINETNGLRMQLVMPCAGGGGYWGSDYESEITSGGSFVFLGVSITGTVIKFYVNGVLKTTNVVIEPIGTRLSYSGANYTVGNIRSINPPSDYGRPFAGKLADIRHHNVILTEDEMMQVYTDGIGGAGVTRGLLFHTPAILTSKLSTLTDQTLASTDRVFDSVNGYAGTPGGSVVVRAIT